MLALVCHHFSTNRHIYSFNKYTYSNSIQSATIFYMSSDVWLAIYCRVCITL